MIRIAVLLSLGRHPASGRARRADLDARALEMALAMEGAEVMPVHAGDPEEPALRDYLGMGLDRLSVLEVPAGCDPVPALVTHMRELGPDLIMCGAHAEAGEGSGMVPYLLGEALDCSIIGDAVSLSCAEREITLVQALARGRRRQVRASLPAVVMVNGAAPPARASAYARARRGAIERLASLSVPDTFLAACEMRPWKARPKRMAMPTSGSAADRMKALTEAKSGEGKLLAGPSAEEAALAIYDYLTEKRFLLNPGPGEDRS